MQASQTLVDTYFFDAGGSVPKTESTVKEGKAKIHVSSGQRVPFAMWSAFLQKLNVQRPRESEKPR